MKNDEQDSAAKELIKNLQTLSSEVKSIYYGILDNFEINGIAIE